MTQEENMNNLKWWILDHLPHIWLTAIIILAIVLSADHAGII